MLAALEAASAAMLTGDGDWSHEETEAYDIIEAAIAKAKGGANDLAAKGALKVSENCADELLRRLDALRKENEELRKDNSILNDRLKRANPTTLDSFYGEFS
jgi:flagellar motility protein MotE (MotC chaperone)